MKRRIIFAALAVGMSTIGGGAWAADAEYRYDGFLPVRDGCEAVVFTNAIIAALSKCMFEGKMGGALVNDGRPKDVHGYNMDYREGERLSVQFQCSDHSLKNMQNEKPNKRVLQTP